MSLQLPKSQNTLSEPKPYNGEANFDELRARVKQTFALKNQ